MLRSTPAAVLLASVVLLIAGLDVCEGFVPCRLCVRARWAVRPGRQAHTALAARAKAGDAESSGAAPKKKKAAPKKKAASGEGGEAAAPKAKARQKGPASATKASAEAVSKGSAQAQPVRAQALQPQPQAGLTEAPEREVQVGLGGEQLLFDEGLLDGVIQEQTGEILKGDTKYNVLGQAEDVVASWTVGGVEIELPDWRPQPNQEYRIVDPSVLEKLGKIENMFGSQVELVSTANGVYRFLYHGSIRNLIGCEAWTKMILIDEVGLKDVKEVRFETNYVRDWPDDWQ